MTAARCRWWSRRRAMPRCSEALDYQHDAALAPGTLVRVPLGRREVAGHRVAGARSVPRRRPTPRCGPIAQVLDAMPPLSPAWLALVEFAAGYYQRALGELALGGAAARVAPARRRATRATAAARAAARRRPSARTTRPTRCGPRSPPSRRRRWTRSSAARRRRAPRRCCCTASPAAARPRSTCAPPSARWRAAARCWCWCPRST